MDILTLELLDVTVFQALLELRELLAAHPGEPLIVRGEDEVVRTNVVGFLEKQGRVVRVLRAAPTWELEAARGAREAPAVSVSRPQDLKPVLVLRSAFAPGDRALGRRLLLEALAALEPGTPWLCLAHQGVELLDDPAAVALFADLKGRGIPVRASAGSLRHLGLPDSGLEVVTDTAWQRLLVRGEVTVL